MPYQREIGFFCRMAGALHIRTSRFRKDQPPVLFEQEGRSIEDSVRINQIFRDTQPGTLYWVTNPFAISYSYFMLPDTEEIFLLGPYMSGDLSDQEIMELLEYYHLQPSLLHMVRKALSGMPQIQDDSMLFALMTTLCEHVFGGQDCFVIERLEQENIYIEMAQNSPDEAHAFAEAANLRIMEDRYEGERHLMHLVSQGRAHRAQMLIRQLKDVYMESRTADSLRNVKNYGVVLHTLLRKAVENGGVHPMYIDRLSSQLARRLEACRSVEECMQLLSSMVHKYCLLVRNHSMKNYSMLVQHVILRVDSDLTADLSLSAHAEALNVNPSYLSTLFKRETGQTLTEYVARKRIDNAIYLLNSTDMQVQTIAQYCGIPDVNYFTKTFKRLIGKTPKEYRIDVRKTEK